jgi:hypothetical protein
VCLKLRTRLAAAERRLLRLSEPERLPERPAVSALMLLLLLLLRRCCCGASPRRVARAALSCT